MTNNEAIARWIIKHCEKTCRYLVQEATASMEADEILKLIQANLYGFDEWWKKRGYETDCPSDRYLAEDAWKAARGLKYYPCEKCGTWRTESEGGTTFTVCDECWDKKS